VLHKIMLLDCQVFVIVNGTPSTMITTNANTTVLFQNHMKLGVIYLQKYSRNL